MPDLERVPLNEALDKLHEAGYVPLGILSFEIEREVLHLSVISSIPTKEVNAILHKFALNLKVDR